VFDRPPETLNEHAIAGTSTSVHRNLHAMTLQKSGHLPTGELRPLIGIENRRRRYPQGAFQCLHAKLRLPGMGELPGQDIPAVPIHDRHEIDEAVREPNVRDVRGPDDVWARDRHPSQPIGIDPMLSGGWLVFGPGWMAPHPLVRSNRRTRCALTRCPCRANQAVIRLTPKNGVQGIAHRVSASREDSPRCPPPARRTNCRDSPLPVRIAGASSSAAPGDHWPRASAQRSTPAIAARRTHTGAAQSAERAVPARSRVPALRLLWSWQRPAVTR
jgi:hypothetical protein